MSRNLFIFYIFFWSRKDRDKDSTNQLWLLINMNHPNGTSTEAFFLNYSHGNHLSWSYLWCSVGGRILLQNPNCIGHSDRPMVLRCMKVYCYTLLFLNLCCYLNMWHSFWVSLLLCGIYLPKTIANNFDSMSTFWKSIYFFFPLCENN